MITLSGRDYVTVHKDGLREAVERYNSTHDHALTLIIVAMDPTPESEQYISLKRRMCEEMGVQCSIVRFDANTPRRVISETINALGSRKGVGVMVQLPVPDGHRRMVNAIPLHQDVDCLSDDAVGMVLCRGTYHHVAPATPQGILSLLDWYTIPVEGRHVVIINRSNLIGKPLAAMLLRRDAIPTIVHTGAIDVGRYTRDADIIVTATGQPGLITADMVKDGVVIIDAGTHVEGKDGHKIAMGDVVQDEAMQGKVFAMTPVPGGVGPMTVFTLLENLLHIAEEEE